MGLFGGLFASPEEKAEREFDKMEALAWKWPSAKYRDVLDVYITGSYGVQKPVEGRSYCLGSRIDLPGRKDREKAIRLIRAVGDPANVKAARSRFHIQGDPAYRLKYILALLTPDEAEREKLFREVCFGDYPYRREVAWYIYSRGLLGKYCRSVEEAAEIFLILWEKPGNDQPSCDVEIDPSFDYGIESWKWHEIYQEKKDKERQEHGKAGLAELLRSRDPEVSARTRAYLQKKNEAVERRLEELRQEHFQLASYAQNVLGMQLVNEAGEKVEIRDGEVRKQL